MKFKTSVVKTCILTLALLSTVFCIFATSQYRMVLLSLSFIGFVFSFLSYSKYLIMNKSENKLILLNSYFDGTITEQVKNISLNEYKSCMISQRNTSSNKESNLTDESTQYANEFYLRIFTQKGVIEPFSGSSTKEKIKFFAEKIGNFFKYQDNNLTLKEDYKRVLRYIGYGLILLSNIIGYTLILF